MFQTMHPLSCDGRQGQRNPTEIMLEVGYAGWQGVSVSGLWSMRSRGSCLRRNDRLFQTMHPLFCDGGQGRKDTTETMVEVGFARRKGVGVSGFTIYEEPRFLPSQEGRVSPKLRWDSLYKVSKPNHLRNL